MIKTVCFLILGLTACSTPPAATLATQAQPALLASNNSYACQQQLNNILGQIMGQPVTVSTSVFSSDSRLLLDKIQPRHTYGMHKDGMSLAKPTVFNLLILNKQCLLAHEEKQQLPLDLCVCQPAL